MAEALGFCGSHRTGKTTIARLVAKGQSLDFVETTTSDVFAANNLSPSAPMDFKTRIWIQDKVLKAAEQIWAQADPLFITDRTPLDMLAYTMADIQGITKVDIDSLEQYIQRCFFAANKYFKQFVLIQPGIKIVPAPGKAALNKAYMAHLNFLILGFGHDPRQLVPMSIMAQEIQDLSLRYDWLVNLLTKGN